MKRAFLEALDEPSWPESHKKASFFEARIQIKKWNANLLRSAAVEGIRVRLRVTVDVRTGI